MLVTLSLLSLLASAIAAPASTSNIDIANQDSHDHVLYVPTASANNALSSRQAGRCEWANVCLPKYQQCVKSCNSLKNSDW